MSGHFCECLFVSAAYREISARLKGFRGRVVLTGAYGLLLSALSSVLRGVLVAIEVGDASSPWQAPVLLARVTGQRSTLKIAPFSLAQPHPRIRRRSNRLRLALLASSS